MNNGDKCRIPSWPAGIYVTEVEAADQAPPHPRLVTWQDGLSATKPEIAILKDLDGYEVDGSQPQGPPVPQRPW